jgi:hypothetical protein
MQALIEAMRDIDPRVIDDFANTAGVPRQSALSSLSSLLVEIHHVLAKQGMTSINDPRVGESIRVVWRKLMNIEILADLSLEQIKALETFDH